MDELGTKSKASGLPTAPPRPEKTRWNKYATRLIRLEMLRQDVSYKKLSQLLEGVEPGTDHTSESLTTRISRGTFTFSFALQVLRVLKVDSLDLSKLPAKSETRNRSGLGR